jgi:hypothetical protein
LPGNGIVSRRFTSLSYASAETRSRLRDRLRRFLPAQGHANVIRRHGPPKLADEALLELLLHLDIAFASDENAARSAYEAELPENSTEPNFDSLINDGWLRVIWGRISTSFEVSRAAQTAQAGALLALNALLRGRFEERCHVADEARKNPDLVPVVESINREETKPHTIGCEWPEWIAARLWDRAAKVPADMNAESRNGAAGVEGGLAKLGRVAGKFHPANGSHQRPIIRRFKQLPSSNPRHPDRTFAVVGKQ